MDNDAIVGVCSKTMQQLIQFSPLLVVGVHQQLMRQQHNKYEVHHK
jgi:hypothetical protein